MPLEETISWFVFVEGQRHGPVQSERLVAFLESHTASHDASHPAPPVYVWREGFTDWRLASDVPELALPPPLPHAAPEPPLAASIELPAARAAASRKLIWSGIGATIGLLMSLPRLLIGGDARLSDPWFLVGYVLGGVLLAWITPRPLVAMAGAAGLLVIAAVAGPVMRAARRDGVTVGDAIVEALAGSAAR